MKLKKFTKNLAQINTYVLYENNHTIVIDPGFNGTKVLDFCTEHHLQIEIVILTHAHYDHIKDIPLLAKTHQFEIILEEQDYPLLFDDEMSYARAFGATFTLDKSIAVKKVVSGDCFDFYGNKLSFLSTPGHTKGSMCIIYRNMIFTGDTLFTNSIGRTDLYGGNQNEIYRSLELLKKKISNDATIYPGHGDHGKMKHVKEINPFL